MPTQTSADEIIEATVYGARGRGDLPLEVLHQELRAAAIEHVKNWQIALVDLEIRRLLQGGLMPIPSAPLPRPVTPTRVATDARRIFEALLASEGPVPAFDGRGEAAWSIGKALKRFRFEQSVRAWCESAEAVEAVEALWGRRVREAKLEEITKAAVVVIPLLVPDGLDADTFCRAVIDRCRLGAEQMDKLAKFLYRPDDNDSGKDIVRKLVGDADLPRDFDKGDLVNETFLEINNWRIRQGGSFDYVDEGAIVTNAARHVIGRLWRKTKHEDQVDLDEAQHRSRYAHLFVDKESWVDDLLAAFEWREFRRAFRSAIQDDLKGGAITPRLAQALLHFLGCFEGGGPHRVAENQGGQRELDIAVYWVLERLEGKPLERDAATGHYTDPVRARKAYLQEQIVGFGKKHFG